MFTFLFSWQKLLWFIAHRWESWYRRRRDPTERPPEPLRPKEKPKMQIRGGGKNRSAFCSETRRPKITSGKTSSLIKLTQKSRLERKWNHRSLECELWHLEMRLFAKAEITASLYVECTVRRSFCFAPLCSVIISRSVLHRAAKHTNTFFSFWLKRCH